MGWMGDLWAAMKPGRPRNEPKRDTTPFPQYVPQGQGRTGSRLVWKATPRNLRYFSRTPYARRAINAIKNPVAELQWEIVPAPGVKETPELRRQIEVATYCFENPNSEDSWRTFVEQVIEDVLIGAGAIETQMAGNPQRPLWMYPVDGLSIQVYPAWSGDRREARYTQSVGYGTYTGGGPTINLRDDELIYLKPNPSTSTPFGTGPLEIAFNSISRQLGVGEFAGNLTTNARPGIMLDMGKTATQEQVAGFRSYWTAEVEGQGKIPIVGTDGGSVMRLYPDGDKALYLEYQEFLKTEIAIAFDLSPQNLGVERDVNRSTGEVSAERDWDQAIKPRAREFASYLTRHALHRRLGFYQLQFRFLGLDREDEFLNAQTFERLYKNNAMLPDEYREKIGLTPLAGQWGKLTFADMQVALNAARGASQVLDDDTPEPRTNPGSVAPDAPKPKE